MIVSSESYSTDLLRFYLTSLEYKGDTELLDLLLGQNVPAWRAVVKVARMELPCKGGSLWFNGSLGHLEASYNVIAEHEHQFVGIYDSPSRALSELVASTYHYHRFIERLDYGHTIPLHGATHRAAGWSAALILASDLYRAFAAGEALVSGVPTKLFSVVPITQAELEAKREGGLDALFRLWDAERKDVLHVTDLTAT